MLERRKLLEELAEEEGLGKQHLLAAATGLTEVTINRYWGKEYWLDKIEGDNLRQLCAACPAIADYVASQRELALLEAVSELGVAVNKPALRRLLHEGSEPAYLAAVLRLGHKLMTAEDDSALLACAPQVSVMWERNRGRCFETALTDDASRKLIVNDDALVKNSVRLFHLLADGPVRRGVYPTHDRARQVLVHYLRLRGYPIDDDALTVSPRRTLDRRCR